MRRHILITLLHKEWLRHLGNRGGIVLALLLVVLTLMLSLWKPGGQGPILGGSVQRCYLIYNEKDDPGYQEHLRPWIAYLRAKAPPEWLASKQFRIRAAHDMPTDNQGNVLFDANAGAIRLYTDGKRNTDKPPGFKVVFWYPGEDSGVLSTYETWFWRESHRYFLRDLADQLPEIEEERQRNIGSADLHSALAPVPVFFALFFACVYLLPSMTCEERERGVLLAQALSPASPLEILVSKFLFYAVLGVGLAAILGGIYRPAVLLMPYFWMVLIVSSLASLSVGLTIATLAVTQRLASVGAMCYLLFVALFLFTMQQMNIPLLPWLFLEWHYPRMLHAALADTVMAEHWVNLAATSVLSIAWAATATVLFRYRGWQ